MGALITFVLVFGAIISIWMFSRNQMEAEKNREYATDTFDSAKKETAELRGD